MDPDVAQNPPGVVLDREGGDVDRYHAPVCGTARYFAAESSGAGHLARNFREYLSAEVDSWCLASQGAVGVPQERALCRILLQVTAFGICYLYAVRGLRKDCPVKLQIVLDPNSFNSKRDL